MAETLLEVPATARGATYNEQVNLEDWLFVNFLFDVTAASGTTPTLDIAVGHFSAAGTFTQNWAEGQLTGGGQRYSSMGPGCQRNVLPSGLVRIVYTIGGTTPSFTINTKVVGVSRSDQ